MSVTIKSAREIELMREAGKILAKTHEELAKALKPGMTTWDIDHLGEEIIRSYGCIPSFKNYNGYPASIGERRSGSRNSQQEAFHRGRRHCEPGCRRDLQGIPFRCGKDVRDR